MSLQIHNVVSDFMLDFCTFGQVDNIACELRTQTSESGVSGFKSHLHNKL